MNNDTRTFRSDGTDMFIDINTFHFLRDELKILSKLQAFAGNPLCGSVVQIVLRNAHTLPVL